MELLKAHEIDDCNIELNKNGLEYNDIENIFKIRNFLKIEIFQDEIYRVNGKLIVIRDNNVKDKTSININELDLSMMKDTLVMKLQRNYIY